MKKQLFTGAIIFVFGLAGNAMAIPMDENWAVDFRSAAWSGANNQDSFTVDGVTADALPNDDEFIDYKLSQDSTDGLGVKWNGKWFRDGDPDEIEGPESLKISSDSGFKANGLWVTDLFGPKDGSDPDNGEVGKISINGGTSEFTFFGKDSVNGDYWVDFGASITIYNALAQAEGYLTTTFWGCEYTTFKNNEFSVAGFTAAPVPEPATMLLFGTGLVGLAGVARRKKK